MNIQYSLRLTAIGLALSSVAFAQSPPPAPPPPAGTTVSTPVAPQLAVITQSSRVRAFNPDPGGEVRSLYLQNGSVIDVTPGLGGQFGPAVRKGAKITVTGTQSEINGQSVIEAASIRLNDQTFAANSPCAAPATPPPAPAWRRKNKAAASAPCEVAPDDPSPPPDWGGPPPPPDGMAPPPPPPDGMGPPPPPPQG